ncbi:MAG TPA: MFS transporter [Ktedonobacterales bacterium]|nr:MFS transporter [Ktedonobacterales bacterium]
MSIHVTPPGNEAAIRATDATAPCARRVERWILIATILGSSLSFIDGTVVNVALPTIQRELHATVANVQWVVEAYSLFLAALILVGGSVGDRLGRRRVFTTGVIIFTLSSVACGLAPTIIVLIVARAAQGIGGALLVPGSLAIIGASFGEDRRGAAIGTWSAFTTVTAALGPVIGGWLVQAASWRLVFFLNVPLAVVTLAVTFRFVRESYGADAHAGHLDLSGAGLATFGLGALVFGLVEWSVLGLGAPLVIASMAVGVAALAAFVVYELRAERAGRRPMIPLSIFRSRMFTGANLLTLLLYGALGGALYFLPFNLQQAQGYSAAQAGAALLPMTVMIFALSRWAGGLVPRVGAKLPLVVGPVIAACGFALFAVPGIGGSYWLTYFPAIVALSLGMALVIAPLTTSVMSALGQDRSGVASGVNNAASRTAGLLAIAIMNLVVVAVFSHAFDTRIAALHLSPALNHALAAQRTRLAAARAPTDAPNATQSAVQHAVALSFVAGFRVAMLIGAALALTSSLMAAVFIEGKGVGEALRAMRPARLRSQPAQPIH